MDLLNRFIHPIYLQRKLCVACTRTLKKAVRRENVDSETELIMCECGRHYIYEKNLNIYKKVSNDELERYRRYLNKREGYK